MSVTFYAAERRPTPADMKAAIPDAPDTILWQLDGDEFNDVSVNVSNSSAGDLLRALGLWAEDENGCPDLCGDADAMLFLGSVLFAEAIVPTDGGMPSYALNAEEANAVFPGLGESGARVWQGARSDGYTHRRLAELRALAEFCRAGGWLVCWS